ncbi:craniofacial development protein 2, partial [Clonorchis sinensis]
MLAETLYSLKIDACCVSETRMQDPSVVMHLKTPRMNSALSHFSLRVSCDPEAMTCEIYGAGVALSPRAERALLKRIGVNSRLCAVPLTSSTTLNASRHKKRCPFVVSAYAPTDCSPDAEKDTFCRELFGLIRQADSTGIVILAGDLNAQVGRLSSLESHWGGRFGVDVRRTDSGERLLRLCADRELFLASTDFQHKRSHRVTWRPPTGNQPLTHLDHVDSSYRWRAIIQDCRSFWGTPFDSDHVMVRARLAVRFPSGPRKSARNISIHYLRRTTIAPQNQSELAQQLSTVKQYCGGSEHVDEAWQNVKRARLAAFGAVCWTSTIRPQDHWTSEIVIHDTGNTIPVGNEYDGSRKYPQRQVVKSLRKDRG